MIVPRHHCVTSTAATTSGAADLFRMPQLCLALVIGVLQLLVAPSSTNAVRIGFVSDTGIGNADPRDRGPPYRVDGQPCTDYKGARCLLLSRARDVIEAVKDNGADIVVHAGDFGSQNLKTKILEPLTLVSLSRNPSI